MGHVTRSDAPPELSLTSVRTHSNTTSEQHSTHVRHIHLRCNHPKKYFVTQNDDFSVEAMGCAPSSPSRRVGRPPMQGHPVVLQRQGRSLNSPERQRAVERECRVHTCTRRGCTPDPTISDGCIHYNLFMDQTTPSGEGIA